MLLSKSLAIEKWPLVFTSFCIGSIVALRCPSASSAWNQHLAKNVCTDLILLKLRILQLNFPPKLLVFNHTMAKSRTLSGTTLTHLFNTKTYKNHTKTYSQIYYRLLRLLHLFIHNLDNFHIKFILPTFNQLLRAELEALAEEIPTDPGMKMLHQKGRKPTRVLSIQLITQLDLQRTSRQLSLQLDVSDSSYPSRWPSLLGWPWQATSKMLTRTLEKKACEKTPEIIWVELQK